MLWSSGQLDVSPGHLLGAKPWKLEDEEPQGPTLQQYIVKFGWSCPGVYGTRDIFTSPLFAFAHFIAWYWVLLELTENSK